MPRKPPGSVGIISEESARDVLDDRHDALFRTVTRAFERIQDGPITLTKIPHIGHLTNAMHALMLDEARDRFSETLGVEIIEGQTFLLKFDDRVLVRFKKVNRELETSNYPTQRARAFDAQNSLADVPALPRITIGYETDPVWSKLQSVTVVFSLRKIPMWNYELTGRSENERVHAFSPLADEVIVKVKKQLTLDEFFEPKKPR